MTWKSFIGNKNFIMNDGIIFTNIDCFNFKSLGLVPFQSCHKLIKPITHWLEYKILFLLKNHRGCLPQSPKYQLNNKMDILFVKKNHQSLLR